MIRTNSRNPKNNYGRHFRTNRRDNARPGDVLSIMGRILFPKEAA